MRSLMRKIDLFCYKHPRFGVNNLMLYIVIGNAAVGLMSLMDTTGTLINLLVFSAAHILRGQIWRLITFVFVPTTSGILFLALMLYFYYWIGGTLERQWGTGRFTIYYLMGMVLAVVYGFGVYIFSGISIPVTATYINLSMFFAFATLFPETQVLLFFIIPVKMKWLAILDAAFFVYEIVSGLVIGMGALSFLPLVAVLNYFVFCGDWLFDYFRPERAKQRKNTVNFRREAARIRYETKNKPYNRKCSVCGRTDADYPELEFRYCSRCAGYHCFCIDHINDHIHYTE